MGPTGDGCYSFTAHGNVDGEFTGNDADFTISASAFTVPKGQWLAFRVTNNADKDFKIVTKDGSSYVSSPETDPGYPVPELSTLVLFSTGLLALAGYIGYSRRKRQ